MTRPCSRPLARLGALALAACSLPACTPLVGLSAPRDGATDAAPDAPGIHDASRGDVAPPDRAPPDAGCATPGAGLRSGARDPSWRRGAFGLPPGVVGFLARGAMLDGQGRIYVYGSMQGCIPGDPTASLGVVRHRADGTLDESFGEGGHACFAGPTPGATIEQFFGGVVDARGRVYLVGQSGVPRDTHGVAVRLDEGGALDPDFNGGRVLTLRPVLPAGVRWSEGYGAFGIVEAEGGLHVTGGDWFSRACVMRVRLDGSVDATFGAGVVEEGVRGWTAMARAGGATYVAGARASDGGLVVRRLRDDGTFDPGFGEAGEAAALGGQFANPRGLAVLPDGAVVVVAASQHPDINLSRSTAARFTPDGALDTGFARGGVHVSEHNLNHHYDFGVVAAQCDGRVLLTSHFVSAAPTRYAYVERLDPGGRLDTGFGSTGGVVGTHPDHAPTAVLVDPRTRWIYLVSRSNQNTSYAIERFAP